MRHVVPALLLAAALVVTGCAAGPTAPAEGSLTPTPTASPAATDEQSATGEPTTVEYVVRAGDVPEEFATLELTLRVVFVDDADDLGPCYPEVFDGPYKPTLTPLPTPAGSCHTSEPVTVDLADGDGAVSLGSFMAPASASGHALVVTDIDAALEDGSTVDEIKGIGGHEAIREPSPPAGSSGIVFHLRAAPESAEYEYVLVSERFEPSA